MNSMWKRFPLSAKIMVPSAVALLVIIFSLMITNYLSSEQSIINSENKQLTAAYEDLLDRIDELSDQAVALAMQIANQPVAQEALANANRQVLIDEFLPAYQLLDTRFGIPQAQFHLPPATSFLRLHDIEHYGDDLSSFRFTVLDANNTGEIIKGIEIGRGGPGIRGVVPVIYQGQQVGSFEVGLNIDATTLTELRNIHDGEWHLYLDADTSSIATLEGFRITDAGPMDGLLSYANTTSTVLPIPDSVYFDVLTNDQIVITRLEWSDEAYAVLNAPLHDYRGEIIGVIQIEFPRTTVIAQIQHTQTQSLLIGLGVASSLLLIIFLITRQALKPIQDLTESAKRIADGDLDVDVRVHTGDEIGVLSQTFAQMAKQLRISFGTLEQRVEARTRDLAIAADVSRQVSRVLDMKQLLPYLANTTQDGFNLSHVSIFLYDENTDILRLAAGSGAVGREMLEAGKQFHLDDVGLVPLAARASDPQIINDVQASQDHYVNPLLPNTRSEVALPMRVGTRLIGILDLQSDEVGRFNDEQLGVLSSLADQIAVAVQNAGLFTNLQSARAEAEQASIVKSQFLASMSHELRTPLNAVLNFTQFVSTGMLGEVNSEQVEMLNKVVSSGKHLLSLINDVLDISKIEAGALKLFIETNIDMGKEAQTVVSTAEGMLAEKPVDLIVDIEPDLPFVVGDKRRIRQIMLNLVSNACKFTEEGEVRISLKQEDEFIRFAVADTGLGIAEEDQGLIFETFRQSESGLRQGEGTGLGLPISRRLAETHGGKLEFVSKLNVGSTFSFTIPTHNPELVTLANKKEKSHVA